MKKSTSILLLMVSVICTPAFAQDPADVLSFDETAEGPWSDIEKTTLTIPKVAANQITLDGSVSSGEYGGFEGVPVIPGDGAWILDYAAEKDWKSADDTSFTFFLAYDDENLFIGVEVKDDIVISNEAPAAYWNDDAVEILIDPLNTRYDANYDNTETYFGGHVYFNWEGKFSEWENDAIREGARISTLVPDWAYGPDSEVYGVGVETDTGYTVEIRMHKVLFIDPLTDFQWREGQDMAFNIGLDDDDGAQLALQYWWANRVRASGYNEEESYNWSLEEIENRDFLNPDISWYDLVLNANGRLTAGGAGEIILGPQGTVDVPEWNLY